MYSKAILILLVVFIASCGAKKIITENYVDDIGSCPIDACTLEGKIIKIHGEENTGSRIPQYADVQVISYIDKGRNFIHSFNEKDTLYVCFTYSLNKTDSILFPNLQFQLPGLKKNDHFKAHFRPKIKINHNEPDWLVYKYIKIEK